MNFHDHPEWISEYLDGRLTDAESRDAERHLSSCSECRRELSELRQTRDAIRSFQSHPAPSEGLEDRILDRADQARRPGWRNARRWAMAAMVLLTVMVCVTFVNEGPQKSELQTSSPLRGEDRGGGDKFLSSGTPHPSLPPQGGKELVDQRRALPAKPAPAAKSAEKYSRTERRRDLKMEMEKVSPSNYAADENQSPEKREISKDEISQPTPPSSIMAKLKNYEAEPAAPAASAPAPAQEAAAPPAGAVGSIRVLSEGGIVTETKQEIRAESPSPAYAPPGETVSVVVALGNFPAVPAEAPVVSARKAKAARVSALAAPAAKSVAPAARGGFEMAEDSTPGFLYVGYTKTNGTPTKAAEKPAADARIILTVADPEKFYERLREEIYKLNAQIEKDSSTLWTVKVSSGFDILSRLDDVFEHSAVDSGVRVEIRFRTGTGKEGGVEK